MTPFQILIYFPVLGVSLYDIYVSIKTQTTLAEMELNPIGRWLIAIDEGVALFLTLKCLGNILAILTIAYLINRKPRIGWSVAAGVVAFQMLLLGILLVF